MVMLLCTFSAVVQKELLISPLRLAGLILSHPAFVVVPIMYSRYMMHGGEIEKEKELSFTHKMGVDAFLFSLPLSPPHLDLT